MHQFHAVLVHDVLEERRLADDVDEFFTSIPVLVDLSNVARGHGLVERHVERLELQSIARPWEMNSSHTGARASDGRSQP